MEFNATALISDMHQMVFFIQQLNKMGISPKVNGRKISIKLSGEILNMIYPILDLYEHIPDKEGKNEFGFTLINNQL